MRNNAVGAVSIRGGSNQELRVLEDLRRVELYNSTDASRDLIELN